MDSVRVNDWIDEILGYPHPLHVSLRDVLGQGW